MLKGYGCPICKKSKGEKKCLKYFQDNNIIFTPQYQYSDLYGVNNYPLRFDFAILGINHNVLGLIEYDGIFHFGKQYDNDGYENLQIYINFFFMIYSILSQYIISHRTCKVNVQNY